MENGNVININAIVAERKAALVSEMPWAIITVIPPIFCADGFNFSVQASRGHYCSPRDDSGPWSHFEVGFPSEKVDSLMEYAENPEEPTETVYGWVPASVIEEIIVAHGGVA